MNSPKRSWETIRRSALHDVLRRVIAVGLVGGAVWHGVLLEVLRVDPLGGAHSALACPMVCDGCTGPYSFSTTTPDPLQEFSVTCQAPADATVKKATANRLWLLVFSQFLAFVAAFVVIGGRKMLALRD